MSTNDTINVHRLVTDEHLPRRATVNGGTFAEMKDRIKALPGARYEGGTIAKSWQVRGAESVTALTDTGYTLTAWPVLLVGIADALPLPPAVAPALPQSAIRTQARAALANGAVGFAVPDDRWNAARVLVGIGAAAWALTGEDLAWWGTGPLFVHAEPDEQQWKLRVLLHALVGVAATPAILDALPLARGPAAPVGDVWIDWISLATGPGRPPAVLLPDGLGQHGDSPLETNTKGGTLDMTGVQGEALDATARALLASLDRPVPRHVGTVLDVALPADLLPQMAAWGVATLRVQPHARGLWVAVLDSTGRAMVAAWWAATATTGMRAPLSIPPAAWSLLHPVLAGLWRDLCADALVVDAEPGRSRAGAASAPRRSNNARRRTVQLPPVQRVPWADAADRAALQRSRRSWQGYRRLPRGWEERATRPDFRRRQQAAVQRAQQLGLVPPPPGFTVQRSGVVSGDAAPEAATVRSVGLFSVLLALQDVQLGVDEDADASAELHAGDGVA